MTPEFEGQVLGLLERMSQRLDRMEAANDRMFDLLARIEQHFDLGEDPETLVRH